METTISIKKITRATIKSFIKKNEGSLFIKVRSTFNGMTDGVEETKDEFDEVVYTDRTVQYTMGITGAWFVGSSRDHFEAYEDDQFRGYIVYNCCGTFLLAIKR